MASSLSCNFCIDYVLIDDLLFSFFFLELGTLMVLLANMMVFVRRRSVLRRAVLFPSVYELYDCRLC